MNAVRVPWSSASFLVYLGGLTVLASILSLLSIQASDSSAGGLVGWSALIFAVLAVLASIGKRTGRYITAGLYALSAAAAFIVFFGALLEWFGWLPHPHAVFRGFRFWLLVLELAAVLAFAVALRSFRFPLLVFAVAATGWFFVTDLISGGGDWSAIVTIAYGLALLSLAVGSDSGGSGIYGFWLHVVAGLTIGGGLLWFFHDGDFDWIVIAFVALGYIALGNRLVRSSWVVLAAWGLLQVTTHFADRWAGVRDLAFFPLGLLLVPFFGFSTSEESHPRPWLAALSYAIAGLVFIVIAQLLARRRRQALPGAELL